MNAPGPRPVWKWWDALLWALAALIVAGAAFVGLAMPLVNVGLIASVFAALVSLGWAAYKRGLVLAFARHPLTPQHRWLLVQAIVRWTFLAVWVLVLRASIIPLQLGSELDTVWMITSGVVLAAALFPLLPKTRISGPQLAFVAAATLFFGGQLVMASLPATSSEIVTMDFPMRSETLVVQGGRSPLINHHFVLQSQRSALDLAVLKNGKFVDGPPNELSSFGCWGEPIHAPLPGTVVKVVNDRPDMAIGKMDREQIVGNHVVLQIAPERFVLFAHLKQGSVTVRQDDHVESGAPIAQCGNSGNTSSPHLHLQVQDHADFGFDDLRTFPIAFRNTVVARGAANRTTPEPLKRNDRVLPRPAL